MLEDVLCEGCLASRLPALFGKDVPVIRRCIRMHVDSDGSQSFTFDGTFTLMEVRYYFRCCIFADMNGRHFVSDVAFFEPVEWQTQVAL